MNAKEQKIKQAYGDYYEICKPDENGWTYSQNHQYYKYFEKHPETKIIDRQLYFRPFELKGIENNNGWIRIESEADYKNLSYKCLVFTDKENQYTYTQYCTSFSFSETEKITHYRLIEKHPKPIY
jgi:hypothetical protein